jgi:ferrous iron transport protein B
MTATLPLTAPGRDQAAKVRVLRVALAGVPNSGKTALFNALTGARQKVANYAGVTVERKEGQLKTADGRGAEGGAGPSPRRRASHGP